MAKKRVYAIAVVVPDPQPDEVSKVVKIRFDRTDPDNYILYRYNFTVGQWEQYIDDIDDPQRNEWMSVDWKRLLGGTEDESSDLPGAPTRSVIMASLGKVF